MNILFLRGFNNYHKRTIIKYTTLADYKSNCSSFLDYSAINFNPNDGVVTEYTVGSANQKENSKILMFEDVGAPDYCVCYEIDKDSNVTIKSRWFILESQRIRAGQYRLALKRDVIADHLDFLINSNCFMEKAQISNINSPFIFNNESMTYNQIKKKEIPLYDSTGTAWLVGYIAKNFDGSSGSTFACDAEISDAQDTTPVLLANTPFASYTATDLLNGITFRTISHYHFFPTNSVPGTFWEKELTAGIALFNKDSNTEHSVDYNTGLYYELQTPGRARYFTGDLGLFSQVYGNNMSLVDKIRPTTDTSYVRVQTNTDQVQSGVDFAYKVYEYLTAAHAQDIMNSLNSTSGLNYQGKSAIEHYNGIQVQIGTKYYQMQIALTQYNIGPERSGSLSATEKGYISNASKSAVEALTGKTGYLIPDGATKTPIYPVYADFSVRVREVPATLHIQVDCPNKADRWTCNDQLFDMFCIPYGAMNISDNKSGSYVTITTRQDAALAAARALAVSYGSNLYDLQILPYCPIKNIRDAYIQSVSRLKDIDGTPTVVEPYIKTTGAFVVDATDHGKDGSYQRIVNYNDTDVILSYVFWASDSHGTFDVNILTGTDKYYQYATAVDSEILKKKISNETEVFRLCSPNYNGVFEYSASKNNNTETGVEEERETGAGVQFYPDMTQINVDYTYRPNNPYIHLNPKFKGEEEGAIYGQDWNDVRGLICGGDFSMGYIVDKFREYQIQNANFQNIFDRQIQNLDVNNRLAREQMDLSNVMNAFGLPVTGAAGGAVAGAKFGGYGAIAGAAAGGAAGLVGGTAGIHLNEEWLQRQQEETRQYAIDQYHYNLGNIKALPYSISRTDCLAENTRLVPFLELYECTEKEIENLMKVLKYNGMTLMTIDKPANFRTGTTDMAVACHDKQCFYMKGRLIMNPDSEMEDDFHIVDALYSEFNKGIYLEGV